MNLEDTLKPEVMAVVGSIEMPETNAASTNFIVTNSCMATCGVG